MRLEASRTSRKLQKALLKTQTNSLIWLAGEGHRAKHVFSCLGAERKAKVTVSPSVCRYVANGDFFGLVICLVLLCVLF